MEDGKTPVEKNSSNGCLHSLNPRQLNTTIT